MRDDAGSTLIAVIRRRRRFGPRSRWSWGRCLATSWCAGRLLSGARCVSRATMQVFEVWVLQLGQGAKWAVETGGNLWLGEVGFALCRLPEL